MNKLGVLDNTKIRPSVIENMLVPVLPIERKPLVTFPPIVGDRNYVPTITCKALTPQCMRQNEDRGMNPGRKFLLHHLQERRRMSSEVPKVAISEPNGNNPSTL